MDRTSTFYGACGNAQCLDCRPIFDADNSPIPGTDTDRLARHELLAVVESHLTR